MLPWWYVPQETRSVKSNENHVSLAGCAENSVMTKTRPSNLRSRVFKDVHVCVIGVCGACVCAHNAANL